jgi:hypothetical protein
MGIFDSMMPDISKMGEQLKGFIAAASAKLDGQTSAIKMLAEEVRKQNVEIARLRGLIDGDFVAREENEYPINQGVRFLPPEPLPGLKVERQDEPSPADDLQNQAAE